MVNRLGLICCGKDKLSMPAPAKDMYITRLFRLRRKVVEATCDEWRIISAKGLIHPDDVIEPYDDWLRLAPKRKRMEIQRWLAGQIMSLEPSAIDLHAGGYYIYPTLAPLLQKETIVNIPYDGLNAIQTYSALKKYAIKEGIIVG